MTNQANSLSTVVSYQSVAVIKPNYAEVLNQQAEVYYVHGKLDEALRACHQAVKLSPDFADGYKVLGNILHAQGKLDAASRAYLKVLELKPLSAEAYLNLGIIFRKLRRLDEAISSYQKAIALNPDKAEAHFNLGNALFELGKLEQAVSSYRQAIALKPNFVPAHFNLGNVLLEFGTLQQAVNSYRQVTQLDPDFAEGHLYLGKALKYQNQHLKAIASYTRAIQIRPNLSDAYIYLMDSLAYQGELETAIACCRQLLQLKPEIANLYFKRPVNPDEANAYNLNVTKKICKSTRDLAATSNSHTITYIHVHPPSQIPLSLPWTPDGKVHDNFREIQGESPEAFVLVVPDGRAWSDLANSVVITSDNQLLTDVSTGDGKVALIFCLEDLPHASQINGTVAFLSVRAGADYYHWMVDVLPRIELMRRSGIDIDFIDNFVINDYGSSFQKESLLALDIPETKILTSTQHHHIKASSLIVPSVPSSLPKWVGNFIDGPPKWVCNFLRDEFLHKKPLENSDKPERIYISRKLASRRRVINENEVIGVLNKFGFISVTLESMSVAEQASWLANAKVVVAPHGAGLTNLVFCTPGIMVIEIFSPRYVPKCYWVMSNQIGLEYYYLLGEPLEYNLSINQLPPISLQLSAMFEDIFINLDSLLNILRFAGVA